MSKLVDWIDEQWWGKVLGMMAVVAILKIVVLLFSSFTGIASDELLVAGCIILSGIYIYAGYRVTHDKKEEFEERRAELQQDSDGHSLQVTRSKAQAEQEQANAAMIRSLAKQVWQVRQRIELIKLQIYPQGTPQQSAPGRGPM